jgi:hypothetical protein
MAVIYFIMQYPKVGYSFLRKEILALEPTNAMEEMPSAPYQQLIDMGKLLIITLSSGMISTLRPVSWRPCLLRVLDGLD